jgi:hypothetical protein
MILFIVNIIIIIVVDHFDLHREVVSVAMSHLDRYLSTSPTTVDKNDFQLLSMTCLYLAIKLTEYKHLLIPGSKSSMDTILQLSRGFFTLEQMEKMEYDILQRLQWHVHPPTPQLFVKHFLFFLSAKEQEVHDLTLFMVELSVMDYFFVSYKPSEVAFAALLTATEELRSARGRDDQGVIFPFQNETVSPNSPSVLACRDRLALIYAQANDHAPPVDPSSLTSSPTSAIKCQETEDRTISPVSIMAAPQPTAPSQSQTHHYEYSSFRHVHDNMETEYTYSDEEGDDL